MMVIFAITLGSASEIIKEVYTEETTNILLIVIGVVLILITAAFFFSGRSKGILSWKLSWLAATMICLTSGWLHLPTVHKAQLLNKAVETNIQIDGARRAYPTPSTKAEKVWILEYELRVKLADTRWDYWNKIQKIAPEKEKSYGLSIIYFVVGALCLLSALFANFVTRKIK